MAPIPFYWHFFPLQSQYFIRNVGVFQFNTQNICRHRAPLSALFLNKITFFCVWTLCEPFSFDHLSFQHILSGLSIGIFLFSFFHQFFFRSKCHFWLLLYLSKYKINKWTKSCLCIPYTALNGAFLYWFSPFISFFFSVCLLLL